MNLLNIPLFSDKKLPVINLHDDFLTNILYEKRNKNNDFDERAFFDNIRKSGVAAINGSYYYPKNYRYLANEDLSLIMKILNNLPPNVVFCKNFSDYLFSVKNNKTALFFSLEGIDYDTEIAKRYLPFLFSISLTWVRENSLASGVSEKGATNGLGLKRGAFDFIERCNDNFVAIDLSHINDLGFFEVSKIATKIYASHSNCRSLCNLERNLTDEQIKIIADKGGVVGLNGYTPFISKDNFYVNFVKHAQHLIKVGGCDCVSLGLDLCDNLLPKNSGEKFDLIENMSQVDKIFAAFSKGRFTQIQIEKIAYRNADRFFADLLR